MVALPGAVAPSFDHLLHMFNTARRVGPYWTIRWSVGGKVEMMKH